MNSPVKDFYVDKTLLITGGFGCIGKLLVSKLLRLNVVKEILLIVRQKKQTSTLERLEKFYDSILFQNMADFDPKFKEKVRIIDGNMELLEWGISEKDREYIKQNVEIVIHGASSLNMEGKLRQTIASNIRGTKILLDLALEMKLLQSFVFISTAYLHFPVKHVKEVFYKPPMDFRDALNLLENFNDEESLNILTAKLLGTSANIYTFSKAVVEDMIRQYRHKLPIAVARPSQVTPTICDPVPGFCDTVLGALVVSFTVALGFMRVFQTSKDLGIDSIPSDVVVNVLLIIAKEIAVKKESPRMFNLVSNSGKMSGNLVIELSAKYAREFPMKNTIRLPKTPYYISNEFIYRCFFIIFNVIPAFMMEFVIKLCRMKPIEIVKLTRQNSYVMQVISIFSRIEVKYDDKNMLQALSSLTDEDRKNFPCTMDFSKYHSYMKNNLIGMQKYLMNESEADLKQARNKMRIFLIVDYFINFILLYLVYLMFLVIF